MTTERDTDGRLFPATRIGPFTISAQGGRGYASVPTEDLPHIEDYSMLEVHLSVARPEPLDTTTLGLPPALARRFPRIGLDQPCIAGM